MAISDLHGPHTSRPTASPDHGERSGRGSGRLRGKVAVITGADCGIGRAVALAYAQEGADLIFGSFDGEEHAQETLRLIEDAGCRATLVAGDLTAGAECLGLVRTAVEMHGRIDILTNIAAHQRGCGGIGAPPHEDPHGASAAVIDALSFVCTAVVPHMPTGGSIINTACIQGLVPDQGQHGQAAITQAIISFSEALALELLGRGIRVNVVAAGPVPTPFLPSAMPGEKAGDSGRRGLIGRPAHPMEITGVFAFLASDAASYVSGATYAVVGKAPSDLPAAAVVSAEATATPSQRILSVI